MRSYRIVSKGLDLYIPPSGKCQVKDRLTKEDVQTYTNINKDGAEYVYTRNSKGKIMPVHQRLDKVIMRHLDKTYKKGDRIIHIDGDVKNNYPENLRLVRNIRPNKDIRPDNSLTPARVALIKQFMVTVPVKQVSQLFGVSVKKLLELQKGE